MKVLSQTISSSYVLSSRVSIPVEISANVLSKKNKTCYFSHFSNQVHVWFLLHQAIRYHLRPVTIRGFGFLAFMGMSFELYFVDIYKTLYDHLEKDNRLICLSAQITINHKIRTILKRLWMTKHFAFIFFDIHALVFQVLTGKKNLTKT